NRAYVHPDGEVIWFYVGYYKSQKTRAQIHSPLHCYPGSGWNPVLKEVVTIHLRDRDIYINRMIIQNGAEKQMVAYWYQAQEKVIADEFIQRLNLILTSFRKHRTDGSLVRISTNLHDNMPEEDWKRIVSFIQAMYPQFIASIPQ
ncbi:MAG: EpsI family protein, partial [Nitrospirae bacterium CG08_land_8_20_14_0_20_52_24]